MKGNPAIGHLGVTQLAGSMEGKEVRFGPAASAYWGITTTVTSNGSVNAMHDSFTPLTGMFALWGMMINSFYGGVGVGFLNFYIFIIIAVFISGLMVGRTPEFLGQKDRGERNEDRYDHRTAAYADDTFFYGPVILSLCA